MGRESSVMKEIADNQMIFTVLNVEIVEIVINFPMILPMIFWMSHSNQFRPFTFIVVRFTIISAHLP